MPRKQREVEKGLCRKGFRRAESHHHFFIYHSLGGEKTNLFTKTSHGNIELSDYLLGRMARQIKLSKSQFFEFVDCTISQQAYEDLQNI
jgi:hypothetical protein